VLVVDDDPVVATILSKGLAAAGCNITLCDDGDAAVRLVRERAFDLVISDMRLARGLQAGGARLERGHARADPGRERHRQHPHPETEKLAEALARLTGETKTAAVTHALRVDSSALLAVLQDEAERRAFNEAMEAAGSLTMSVASFVEASIVIEVRYGAEGLRALDRFVDRAEMSS